MMSRPCAHEDAVLAAALEAPRVPMPAGIADHLADCESCRDLHTIASALHDDHAAAIAEARVPSAGQAWWRAELRARQEAAAAAARPITVVTGLAAASLIGVLASIAGVVAWWLQSVAGSVVSVAATGTPTGMSFVLWLAAGVLVVATPVLLYVALREE